jgi:hypothetical protein
MRDAYWMISRLNREIKMSSLALMFVAANIKSTAAKLNTLLSQELHTFLAT